MTLAEIEAMITGFVQGALCVKAAGGDGVELHGAQGHLIQPFREIPEVSRMSLLRSLDQRGVIWAGGKGCDSN